MDERWNRFFRQFQRDLKLFLFLMALLSVNRAVFLYVFRNEIGPDQAVSNVVAAFLVGLRFDAMVSCCWLLVPLVLSASCRFRDREPTADRIRGLSGGAFVVTTVLLGCLAIEYYREYRDVFHRAFFQCFYEDTGAILTTVYQDYHLVSRLGLCAVLIGGGLWLGKLCARREFVREEVFGRFFTTHWRRGAATLVVAVFFATGIRGSLLGRPVRLADADVTADRFLDKAALNPYVALGHATEAWITAATDAGLKSFLPDEDVRRALQEAFPREAMLSTVDQYLERTARGPKMLPPRHIFLLDMESYDAWPLIDTYRALRVVENGRRLAREGLHVLAFLPDSTASNDSQAAIVTGLPFASVKTYYETSSHRPLPTSLPETLRRMGYRTRLFHGGSLSPENLGDFCRNQGFDEVYGRDDTAPEATGNGWGVDDEFLFDLVARTVNDEQPSFNFVMTTSCHAPFSVDLESKGLALKGLPPELEPLCECDQPRMLRILGHLRYADQCMGEFVQRMEKTVARPLFVITGDHYGRQFIHAHPTLFERSAVPLILYGKEVLQGVTLPENVAGSHSDIAPTLIEAVAPKGFRYHAMGCNLLEPRERFLGVGADRVIGHDFVAEIGRYPAVEAIPGRRLPADYPDLQEPIRYCHRLQGIAWWRVRKGPTLPEPVLVGPGEE